jgi:hypothetical protein
MIRDSSAFFLFTDASDDGWGAHVDSTSAWGLFPDELKPESSTHRELAALLFALRTPCMYEHIRSAKVTFMMDSLAAVYNLNKGGGPVLALSMLVRDIWQECLRHGIDATADWISRDKNEFADSLSRYRDRADWGLNPDIFAQLNEEWGPHTVDRFASAHNTLCERFNSRYYDPQAEACDAFAQDWHGENNFANADFNDIPRVLAHAERHRCLLTLIFPEWVAKPWYNALLLSPHLVEVRKLPPAQTTFVAGPRSSIFASGIPNWTVFAGRFDFTNTNKKRTSSQMRSDSKSPRD